MEEQEEICPECNNVINECSLGYWGCCECRVTQEMRDKASKEDFEDNNSICPGCKEYVANTYFDDDGRCFDCVWGADVTEADSEHDKEMKDLKNQKNKINRRISTLKKATLKQ